MNTELHPTPLEESIWWTLCATSANILQTGLLLWTFPTPSGSHRSFSNALRWNREKWPSVFDSVERELELTVTHAELPPQNQLHNQLGGTLREWWPLPIGAIGRKLLKEKDNSSFNDVWLPSTVNSFTCCPFVYSNLGHDGSTSEYQQCYIFVWECFLPPHSLCSKI